MYFIYLLIGFLFLNNQSFALVSASISSKAPFSSALIVGIKANNEPLFLCSGFILGVNHFGFTQSNTKFCFIAKQGKVIALTDFIIPNEKEFGHYYWSAETHHPIQMGKDVQGRAIFLCQTKLNGEIFPGLTWAGYPHCNIAYNGKELITDIATVFSHF